MLYELVKFVLNAVLQFVSVVRYLHSDLLDYELLVALNSLLLSGAHDQVVLLRLDLSMVALDLLRYQLLNVVKGYDHLFSDQAD